MRYPALIGRVETNVLSADRVLPPEHADNPSWSLNTVRPSAFARLTTACSSSARLSSGSENPHTALLQS